MDGETMQVLSAEDLFLQFEPPLRRVAAYILHGHQSAEDYIQDTFVHLWKIISEHPEKEIHVGYAIVTLKNVIFKDWHKRKRRSEIRPFQSLESIRESELKMDDPTVTTVRSERAQQLDQAALDIYLDKFTPEEEQVHYLYAVEGLDSEEIAKVVKQDVPFVKHLIKKLRSRLKYRAEQVRRFGNANPEWRDEVLGL